MPNPMDIVEVRGSRISFREAQSRSQAHWLYRLFDADERLLYVGQTRNPVARFHGWFSRSTLPRYRWFNEVVRVDWIQHPDWWAVTEAEKRAIESEAPRHNRQHQPLRVA